MQPARIRRSALPVAIVLGLVSLAVVADTITVHPDGPPTADYATIQGAIDAAVNGDEGLSAPGTYDLTQELIVNDKAITIRGSGGADVTILKSSGLFGIMLLSNVESDTVIDGRAFADSSPLVREWVVQFYGSPTIQNCAFYDCKVGITVAGGLTRGPAPGKCRDLKFYNNVFYNNETGLMLWAHPGGDVDGVELKNNIFLKKVKRLVEKNRQ